MNKTEQTPVEKFEAVLDSDFLVGADLMQRIAIVASHHGVKNEYPFDKIEGIALGACAMYRALTEKTR